MFSHLHLHSEYSLLNGMCRIAEAVKMAKEQNMPAVALTDYGNVFGGVDLFLACKKADIKPVLGCELFLPSFDDHKLRQFKRNIDVMWNLVLIVKNEKGYKNLSQIITKSYLEGFYYKPRIDTKLLQEYSEGLICLSSGFNSEINHHLYGQNFNDAVLAAEKYAKIFPENFYIELQDNGLFNQKEINQQLIEIANKVGLPVVATNHVHYLKRDDAEAFEVLMSIQNNRMLQSSYDSQKYSTDGYYFKTAEEMAAEFSYCPQALEATQLIVDQCNFQYDFKTYHFPKFELPPGLGLDDYLDKEVRQGLDERWELIKVVSKKTDADRPFYQARLELELECIKKMGFSGYFLIVSDFIKWAKDHNIPVGPGRGSAAGSLVAYSIKITDLDPIPYNLLFERFLNPERISMPDVDVDFCQDRRGEVIEYVNQKYGNVSQIVTFGKLKAKAVLRDVGRVMDLEYDFVDRIAKLVPNALNITLAEALEQEPRLKDLFDDDPNVHRLISTALRLEGLSRHASTHAAGVVITDKPLWEFVPLYKGSNEDIVTHYDMKCLEKIGLIKFDFLGLKTLTVIHKAVINVAATCGIQIDISKISMEDEAVYKQLSTGDGTGVFQLESSGMRDLMARLAPGTFEDIVALVALYRPGPLGSGMVDDFIERKKGNKEIVYELPQLEAILKDTYGVIVYQEQVMQISAVLASYSLGEADLLRRAMGKKDAKEMAAQRTRFLDGAAKNTIDPEKAGRIFDLMAMFAEYGFNKSHSAAYALISYQTAYLKTHFCEEYMAALMSTESEDTDKLLFFIKDCLQHGLEILPPDLNMSQLEFTVVGPKQIRYALGALKGVGGAAIEAIIEARKSEKFKSLFDFCSRVDLRRVTKKVFEVLIKSGAMDEFGMSRKSLLASIETIIDAAAKRQKDDLLGQSDLFAQMESDSNVPVGIEFINAGEWTQNESLEFEKEAFGFYFSDHPLRVFEGSLAKLTTHNIAQLTQVSKETEVAVGGIIIQHRAIKTKKGDLMAFATLEDLSGKVEIIIFSRIFTKYSDFLTSGEPLIIKGSVDRTEEGDKIIVNEMHKLTESLKQNTRSIHLDIPYDQLTPQKITHAVKLIREYQGNSLVYWNLIKVNDYNATLEFPKEMNAMACEALQFHLNHLFETKVVRFE